MKLIDRIIRKALSPVGMIQYRIDQNRLANYIIETKKNKRAFLFGAPNHSNMGDQAQILCIQEWIKKNYPEYTIVLLTYSESTDKILKAIRNHINKQDMLLFRSGYHLTDLYLMKDLYCDIVQLFSDYKIVIFPQTIHFINEKEKDRVAEIFNHHGNITLLCRDEVSYKTAQTSFLHCKLYLYPDIVTTLIGEKKYDTQRSGILFCIRNDKESLYGKSEIDDLKNKLKNRYKDIKINQNDTTIPISYAEIRKNRKKVLDEILDDYSKYQLIITDRYHGTIFSLVANTPVIVIASTDHKLSSGVKWFSECFKDYVFYAEDLNSAYNKVDDILNNKTYNYQLPHYFEQNYYSKLKALLEDEIMPS